jgi:DNA-binding NarL/FixJ family response regulator
VGEAADGLEALQRADELQPDLVLLDIHLPKLNGIQVAIRIGHASPGVKVLFTSQSTDADLVNAALSKGAHGYLLKVDAGKELLPAIESVLRGERFASRGVRQTASL